MNKILWRDVATEGEAFHAARNVRTRWNPVPLHGHDFAEIFWIDAGKAGHRVNGEKVGLTPGSLVMMRPSDRHAIDPTGDEALECTNIAFPKETYHFLQRRYFPGREWAFWSREKIPFCVQLDPSQRQLINRWADMLASSPRERFPVERFLINVLGELEPKSGDSFLADIPDWLLHACQEIHRLENFSKGVQAFFQIAGRSREHVARSCQHALGVTPTQYVNRIRMAYAAGQLEMSNRDIVEIALDCGIENMSHFYKLFGEAHGITPRAYKLKHRKLL